MTATDNDLLVTAEPAGKTKYKVTVTLGGNVLHVDTVTPASATARAKFIDAVTAKFPGLDPDRLGDELLKLAAAGATPAASHDHLPEVDVGRVVRPELFHTPDVSGITVPVVNDLGGKLVPRWRTYLRWADGRREVTDVPDRLVLADGTVLYVHPDPGGPPGSDPPAWQTHSRRGWLAGAAAPDPGKLFRVVSRQFAEYLDFPPETAPGTTATLALWAVLSYAYPAWDAVPYLHVGGPMGSGKSRVLDVLERLVFRPTTSSNVSVSVVFRTLHANGGTFLLDEAERIRQSTPDQMEILSMFLAGYRRGGCAIRNEAVGDSFQPTRFQVYGPKVMACIAGLPPTLASRCIPILMFRTAADSPKPKLRLDGYPNLWPDVRDDLHRLALEHGPEWVKLAGRKDVVPEGIGGRNYELWQPLLALAGWFQDRGAGGLLDLMQRHALASVAGAKDDAVPEADEVLLELLAERVRVHDSPTSGELLAAAKLRDEVAFKLWHAKTVANRLKTYGIGVPAKVAGQRRYRDVTPGQLLQIQQRYGIELGMV